MTTTAATTRIIVNASALESVYQEPDRPISQHELIDRFGDLYRRHGLGDVWACHQQCGHFYRTRMRSAKESAVKEGTKLKGCSACWALRNVAPNLSRRVLGLYDSYRELHIINNNEIGMNTEKWQPQLHNPVLTWNHYDLEKTYYDFLYGGNEEREKERGRGHRHSRAEK